MEPRKGSTPCMDSSTATPRVMLYDQGREGADTGAGVVGGAGRNPCFQGLKLGEGFDSHGLPLFSYLCLCLVQLKTTGRLAG